MDSHWKRAAKDAGATGPRKGSWKRRAAEALGVTGAKGGWPRRIAEDDPKGTTGSWERRAAGDDAGTKGGWPARLADEGFAVNLSPLTLAASTIAENSAAGTGVGAVLGKTAGSTLSLIGTAGNRFALSGTNIVAGATTTDFETVASHSITIRETLAEAVNSPRDTVLTITVTDVFEAVFGDILVVGSGQNVTIPSGVTSICIVAIGYGGSGSTDGVSYIQGGQGGGLSWVNNIAVTPGEVLQVQFGGGVATSRLMRGTEVLCSAVFGNGGGLIVGNHQYGGGGGYRALNDFGNGEYYADGDVDGGGAGGYTGPGAGGNLSTSASGRGGGGILPFGGTVGAPSPGFPVTSAGANYGGGGSAYFNPAGQAPSPGGLGCVRLLWGSGRAFQNTNVGAG